MERSLAEKQIESEKIGLIYKEKPEDVLAWITSPQMGTIEREWDTDE